MRIVLIPMSSDHDHLYFQLDAFNQGGSPNAIGEVVVMAE
jgi:hypothetical protein